MISQIRAHELEKTCGIAILDDSSLGKAKHTKTEKKIDIYIYKKPKTEHLRWFSQT